MKALSILVGAVLALRPATATSAADPATKECLVALEDARETVLGDMVTCHDGDPSCDADGAPDGVCTFEVRACVNVPGIGACEPRELTRFVARPTRYGLTVSPLGSTFVCGAYADVAVRRKRNGGARRARVLVRARGGPGRRVVDVDRTVFDCEPPFECADICECSGNPSGGPSELRLTVGATGNDLDIGWSGLSHDFQNVRGATLTYCLTGCNATTNAMCRASGSTGSAATSLNGPTFGPPLPLFSAGVAVCVVNRFQDPTIDAVVNVQTGELDATATPLRLFADTYQGTSSSVCPRCVNGRCDGGRNQGGICHVDGTVVVDDPPNVNDVPYGVSRDCLPDASNLLGTPQVVLPLTTRTSSLAGDAAGAFPCPDQTAHDACGAGTCTVDCSATPSLLGGINQTCCSNATGRPCFPSATAGQIVRTGTRATPSPPWPDATYPKTSDVTLAAVFCIPSSQSRTVDATAGLPGPGALLLSGTMQWGRQ